MKIAFIGQDVPTLLPALLTDLLFAGHEADARVTVEEGNPAYNFYFVSTNHQATLLHLPLSRQEQPYTGPAFDTEFV